MPKLKTERRLLGLPSVASARATTVITELLYPDSQASWGDEEPWVPSLWERYRADVEIDPDTGALVLREENGAKLPIDVEMRHRVLDWSLTIMHAKRTGNGGRRISS
ncbi:hypothetical protein C8J56DRAFT_1056401 [Mycena floridula]|nr:hypothetical protein C8J56DRAFT_1056401 [Mycena floridula]